MFQRNIEDDGKHLCSVVYGSLPPETRSRKVQTSRNSYALLSAKAKAVAQDTLVMRCCLASTLGLCAIKSELEDFIFVVLQPQIFCQMRSDLASMWKPESKLGSFFSLCYIIIYSTLSICIAILLLSLIRVFRSFVDLTRLRCKSSDKINLPNAEL